MSARPGSDDSRATATYAYCLLRCESLPSLAGAPPGIPGAGPLRGVAAGDGLWIVAASVPLPDYGAEAIEARLHDLDWIGQRALAHQHVVEHVAEHAPVVPLKLFTLFHDDARAAAELGGRRQRLDAILGRIAGKREWGLRVHFDAERARRTDPAPRPAGGRDYLRHKQQQRDRPRRLIAEARRTAAALFEHLRDHADAAIRSGDEATAGTLLLEAAFLVPDAVAAAFERRVEAESRRIGAATPVVVTLSGPFPPYSFVEPEPAPPADATEPRG